MPLENVKMFGGRMFAFGLYPPTEAVKIEIVLAGVLGEPLVKALMTYGDAKKNKLAKEEMTKQIVPMAIGLLSSKLDPDIMLDLMRSCFKYVGVKSEKHEMASIAVQIDEVFMGRNRELWEVFFYSLRVNFSDFFPESLFDSLKAMAPMALK